MGKTLQILNKNKNQLIIVCFSYIALCIFGFCMSWTVPVVVLLEDANQTPLPEVIDDIAASWIGSFLFIGSITSPYEGNIISTKYGRKPCFLWGGSFCTIAFLLQSFFTKHITVVYLQRVLQGFGATTIYMNNAAYIGEITSAEIRGSALGLALFFSGVGGLLLIILAPFLSFVEIGYLGLFICVIYLTITIWILPESPLWLALNGKHVASEEVMKRLNRKDILMTNKEPEEKSSWTELFQSKSYRKALFITMPLLILQSLSGLTMMTFFITSIFEMANLNINSNTATIITVSVSLAVTFTSSGLVEKAGRRVILLISTFGASFAMVTLGCYFYLDSVNYSAIDELRWLPLVSVALFVMFYNFGFGVIPFTLMGEMFDKNVRSLGPAFTVLPSMLVNFIITAAFGYMITYIGVHTTFWLHGGVNLTAFLFTLAFVPETKGKTLEEIQELLKR